MMLRKYEYRRRLPHYQSDLKAIFVTFATYQRRILSPIARTICLDVCVFGDGKRFTLHGVVIMPDHVHIVLTPLFDENGFVTVAEIMQTIKSTSAHRINYALGRRGRVWQEESFDHVLRREEKIGDKLDYIFANPVRAGLVERAEEYAWLWPKVAESGSIA
jgi:REP element-mobilizing transposase RayT